MSVESSARVRALFDKRVVVVCGAGGVGIGVSIVHMSVTMS